MKFSRNWFLGVSTTALVATAAFAAAQLDRAAINKSMAKVIADVVNEFNDNGKSEKLSGKATFQLTQLANDDDRVTLAAAKGGVAVTGPIGKPALMINSVSYTYGDGSAPVLAADLGLNLDVLKLVRDRKELNQYIDTIEEKITGEASELLREYGDAATVEPKIIRKDLDSNDNVTRFAASIKITVDPTKLPATKPIEEVDALGLFATLDVNVDAGTLSLKGTITANPKNRSFEKGQSGLKEFLEGFVASPDSPEYSKSKEGLQNNLKMLLEGASYVAAPHGH